MVVLYGGVRTQTVHLKVMHSSFSLLFAFLFMKMYTLFSDFIKSLWLLFLFVFFPQIT